MLTHGTDMARLSRTKPPCNQAVEMPRRPWKTGDSARHSNWMCLSLITGANLADVGLNLRRQFGVALHVAIGERFKEGDNVILILIG